MGGRFVGYAWSFLCVMFCVCFSGVRFFQFVRVFALAQHSFLFSLFFFFVGGGEVGGEGVLVAGLFLFSLLWLFNFSLFGLVLCDVTCLF